MVRIHRKLDKFVDIGLKYVCTKKVAIDCLSLQFIPKTFSSTIWTDQSVLNSPHVEILRLYVEHGFEWGILLKSRYCKMFEFWDSIRNFDVNVRRNKKYIKSKVKNIVKLYESIRTNGYKKNRAIDILDEPFWKSRYGVAAPSSGYEIWHGHHRAACSFLLGLSHILCNTYKDVKPGTKECKKWDNRLYGVLDKNNWIG